MMCTTTRIRLAAAWRGDRLFAAAAGAVAVAAISALSAPAASAVVTRVGVLPGLSFGSATNYGAGCSYMVNAYLTDPVTPVYFYDNGAPLGVAAPSGGIAQRMWTPAIPGRHRLEAVQYGVPGEDVIAYVDIPVSLGLDTGSGCNVF